MIGETIKDFKLVAKLGKGGMGEVWVAEQQIVKTKVAIKFLLEEISTDRQHVQRFFNEAIAVSKIKHAGIVKIFDVGFHGRRAYLIMEYLEGETLAARLARAGRLPIGAVADVGRQIASILEATHAAGVTHRDLKPDNVYLVPDAELASKERIKLLDYGIAKLNTGAGTGMTATGGSMGTPPYMAPEQWTDAAKADHRADVYSLGCLVFEVCCGRTPFVTSSIGEACNKHLNETPPRAGSLAPDVPRALDDMIARMLAKRAADRPTMREIATLFASIATERPALLDTTMTGGGNTTLGGAAHARARSPRKRPRTFMFAIGAVLVAGIGITIVAATRKSGEPEPEPTVISAAADAAVADTPPQPVVEANRWVRIDPPKQRFPLGIPDEAPADWVGFRVSRKIHTPKSPFAIQEHEVTWGELDPWLAKKQITVEYPAWATDSQARERLPASAITWSIAHSYCQDHGGSLPSEEQWEYAARGEEDRMVPWDIENDDPTPPPLDRTLTRAYAGPTATPAPVMTSDQDRTLPNREGLRIYDLIGNVQEWTEGLWREDLPGKDESKAQSGLTSVRAIRGFPLAVVAPNKIQEDAAAYREKLCATGPCVEKGKALRAYIGFRCVKPVAP